MVVSVDTGGSNRPRRVIVTGATQGIGRALVTLMLARGLSPIAVGRWSTKTGVEARNWLLSQGCVPKQFVTCDLADQVSLETACASIAAEGAVEGIISNAGIYLDDERKGPAPDILKISRDMLNESFCVNTWASLSLVQYFMPRMLEEGRGRIVIVSSGMGRCCEANAHAPAYRLSKSASLMLVRILAHRLVDTGVSVHASCPGWARTRMGGPNAVLTAEEAADDVLFTYLNADVAPQGTLVRHGRELKCHVALPSDRTPRTGTVS